MKKSKLLEIKEEIKRKLPDFYKELEKKNISEEKIYDFYPIFSYYFNENEIEQDFTLEFSIENNEINFHTKPKSSKAILIEKQKNIKKNYLITDFDENKLLLDLNVDIHKVSSRKKILTFIKSMIENYPNTKGYWLYGGLGVGKTFISIALLNKFSTIGKKVSLILLPELIAKLKGSFSQDKSPLFQEVFTNLIEVDVLVIDDIGTEHNSEWVKDDILFPILNNRMENKKLTCFTSNLSIKEYSNELNKRSKNTNENYLKAKRIIDRIETMVIEINLEGTNKRQKD